MSFACEGISAEALRKSLLDEKGIGVVSIQDRFLRVAFSGVEESGIEELFAEIASSAESLAK
jgi:hypothetical protein